MKYLGRTSVAHIYRVVHTLLEQSCFLKIVARDATTPTGMPESLQREAQTTARAQHQTLLRVVDAGVTDELAYLTQEWSDGPNLRNLIDRCVDVPMTDILALALQLLDALCNLHKHGAILRLFDPERILAPVRGGRHQVKLFDLSRVALVGERAPAPSRPDASATHRIKSTRYMAPEEIREGPIDVRSDLYSLGVLLYELVTGEFPYATKGSGPAAYVAGHLREEPHPIALDRTPGVPADLPGIIKRMLAKRPDDRFPTAEAARRAVEDVVIPDLLRLNTATDRHVLETWRKRVKTDVVASAARMQALTLSTDAFEADVAAATRRAQVTVSPELLAAGAAEGAGEKTQLLPPEEAGARPAAGSGGA